MISPMVDDQLLIHPQTDAVVAYRMKRDHFCRQRPDLTSPAHRKRVRTNARRRRPTRPIELHRGVRAHHARAGEIRVIVIRTNQPGAVCGKQPMRCGDHQGHQ